MSKFGDTPTHHVDSLCKTCRNSQIIKGQTLNQELTLCHYRAIDQPLRISYPVTECSEYDDKRIPSLWQMEKVAFRFSADDRKKTVGFMSPGDWKKKCKAEDKDPDDDLSHVV